MKKFTLLLFACLALALSTSADTRSEKRNGGILCFYDDDTMETVEVLAPVKLFDEFSQGVGGFTGAATPWLFSAVNSGGLSIQAASSGILSATLGTADNDDAELVSESIWWPGKYCAMEARIACGTPVIGLNVGFNDSQNEAADTLALTYSGTTLTSTASDCALFFYDSDATTDVIRAVAVKADTDGTPTATSTAIAANTYHIYRIEINADGDVSFWLDGEHVATDAAAITVATPLCTYIGAIRRDGAAGSVLVYVDYIRAWQKR